MSSINPYISFNGNCEKAFTFYQSVFGGELLLCRYKEAPADSFPMAEHEKERIMHVSLPIGRALLMGADCSESCGQKITMGDNIAINFCPDSAEEAKRVFEALGKGGTIIMPLEKPFWADLFGMLVDQFGISWMVNYESGKKCCGCGE